MKRYNRQAVIEKLKRAIHVPKGMGIKYNEDFQDDWESKEAYIAEMKAIVQEVIDELEAN